MNGPVVVTGANGFIGKHLVAALADKGFEVRAVVRRHRGPLPGSGIQPFAINDLVDADWGPILTGADAVVHLAAIAHQRTVQDRKRVFEVNVTAVSRLAAAAKACGVRRLALVSSVGVLGSSSGTRAFTEASVPDPHDFYSFTKLESERAARLIADDHSLELSIIRPPLVFGPDAPGNFGRLVRLLYSRWPIPLGALHPHRSLISVWNLSDFLIHCIDGEGAVGAPLLIADDETIGLGELLRTCGEIIGRDVRLLSVPVPILRLMGALLGRRLDVERITESLIVDTSLSKKRLGWKPPLTMREGLIRTLIPRAVIEQGYHTNGRLKPGKRTSSSI